jgi:cell wall-associated NlpC family hydrolase
MKQISTIFSTCIAFVLMVSCAAPKPMGKTAGHSNNPEFMDGITLNGGSNTVKLTQKNQVHNRTRSSGPATDIETMEHRLNSLADIRNGKRGNNSLYSFIEEWYGTPYRFGGSTKNGIDCSAFVQQLYDEVYNTGLTRTSRDQFATSMRLNNMNELKEGDLVFFKIRSKAISHVGVYLSDGKFVHASLSRGVVISNLNDHYWSRYFAGAGRISG